MKILAPKYYLDFKCVADKCSHSCCVGWEIDVDESSLQKYKQEKSEYAKEIVKSIKRRPTPHFKLKGKGRCYHLDKRGLCKIITNLGEDFLCDICREHPRFYSSTPFGLEVGLGLSCEEACKIILSSDTFADLIQVGEDSSLQEEFTFNPIEIRNEMLNVLNRSNSSYADKIRSLQDKFSVSLQILSDLEWKKLLKSLEYLNKSHKKLFLSFSSSLYASPKIDAYLERALAYFIYRYVTKAESMQEIKSYLGLCLFLERLLCSIFTHNGVESLEDAIPLAVALSEEIEYSEDNLEAIRLEFTF